MYSYLYNSPIGLLKIKANENGILEISIVKDKFDNKYAEKYSDKTNNENNIINKCKQELDEYFAGKRTTFDVPIIYTGTEFQNKVWKEINKIPLGKEISYKELAKRIKKPSAIRAAANAVGKNKILILIPCHRILGSDKSLTGFSAGIENKKYLLDLEGIEYV